MKVLNVIKCEFIKNYHLKNVVFIIAILFLSVIILTKVNINEYHLDDKINFDDLITETQNNLNATKNMASTPLKQKYFDTFYNRKINLLTYLKNDIYKTNIININDVWLYDIAIETILRKEKTVLICDLLLNERDNKEIKDLLNSDNNVLVVDDFSDGIYLYKDYSKQELTTMARNAKDEIKDLEKIIAKGSYYDYEVYLQRNGYSTFDELRHYQELVMSKKINDANDYNYQNIFDYEMFFYPKGSDGKVLPNKKYPIVSLDEFTKDPYLSKDYLNYETYLNAYKLYQKDYNAKMHKIEYALEYNLPSNLLNKDLFYPLFTAQHNLNTMPKLSFIIMLLLVLTSSFIITDEYHKSSTILFTSGIKREKILLGKFLYLIIHSYLMWIILFIIMYLYSGFTFGFRNLFYPALFYTGTKVIKVNYILYNIIKIIIINIPIIAFISLIILLSTLLHSIFITVISTIISILTSFIWTLICESNLTFLTKTVIPYFNLYEVIKHQNILSHFNTTYQNVLCFANTSLSKALIISLITIIINYLIANYLFKKKEI